MTTVDALLLEIANYGFDKLTPTVSRRDFRILRNLTRLVKIPEFISENQGSLLIKILKENKASLSFSHHPVDQVLSDARWSRQFRHVEQIRKIFTFSSDENEKFIGIEFTYTSSLKKIVQNMQGKVNGTLMLNVDKRFFLPLTEKNVVVVVETLKSQNFDISTEILEFYKTIKSWRREDFAKKFNFHELTNTRLLSQLSDEIGNLENSQNQWIEDRKIRYQYDFHPEVKEVNLTYQIADRAQSKIWIDPQFHALEDVIASLIELKRLPLMVVFSSFSEENGIGDLKKLTDALRKNNITDDIGVYFRYDNTPTGKEFNQYIADNQLNSYLNENTKVTCVSSGKLPKFFISNKWQPGAVISFTNNLKNNKTSVYCNDCDLIVYYNNKQPLSDFITKPHVL
jgi:hypothetical protein